MTGLTARERLILGAIALVTALVGVAHYAGAAAVPAFIVAGVALAGLAHMVSFATEQVGELAPVYIGALFLTAIAVWQITGDGEAAAFEGWALVGTYVVLAALALYE